jgi:hypothetical protein
MWSICYRAASGSSFFFSFIQIPGLRPNRYATQFDVTAMPSMGAVFFGGRLGAREVSPLSPLGILLITSMFGLSALMAMALISAEAVCCRSRANRHHHVQRRHSKTEHHPAAPEAVAAASLNGLRRGPGLSDEGAVQRRANSSQFLSTADGTLYVGSNDGLCFSFLGCCWTARPSQ